MASAPTANAAPNIHLFMLPIIPPFCADRFASPARLATTLELVSCCSIGLPFCTCQTPAQRKVAQRGENKSPQLFGEFVFVSRVFLPINATHVPSRYPEVRPVLPVCCAGGVRSVRPAAATSKEIPMSRAQGNFTVDIHPLAPAPAEGIGRF
jgi:hypothetical protein